MISFSEDVKPSTGAEKIVISDLDAGVNVFIHVNDPTKVECFGNHAVIHPTSDVGPDYNLLEPGKTYQISYERGAFLDLYGNPARSMEKGDMSFKTAIQDSFNPKVLSTYPPDGHEDVSVKPTLNMIFTEHVFPVMDKSIIVKQLKPGETESEIIADIPLSNIEKGVAQLVFRGATVFITLQEEFSFASTVEVTVPHGAFEDFAGNPVQVTTFTFKTSSFEFTKLVDNQDQQLVAENKNLPARSHFGCVAFKESIFVMGGLGKEQRTYGDSWKSDDGGLTFHKQVPAYQGSMLGNRYGANHFVATQDRIYAMGGGCYGDGGYLPDPEGNNDQIFFPDGKNFVYSEDGKDWQAVFGTKDRKKTLQIDRVNGKLQDGMDYPFWMCGQSILVVGGWQLYVLGGGTGKMLKTLNPEATIWEIVNEATPFDCEVEEKFGTKFSGT